jgi:hypothetical protein
MKLSELVVREIPTPSQHRFHHPRRNFALVRLEESCLKVFDPAARLYLLVLRNSRLQQRVDSYGWIKATPPEMAAVGLADRSKRRRAIQTCLDLGLIIRRPRRGKSALYRLTEKGLGQTPKTAQALDANQ